MSSELERIETMCIQNNSLLVALADLMAADGPEVSKKVAEVKRAINDARPYRREASKGRSK